MANPQPQAMIKITILEIGMLSISKSRNQNESIVAESFLHCFRNKTWMFVSDMIARGWRSLWEGVLFFWKIDLIFNFVIFLCLKFSW